MDAEWIKRQLANHADKSQAGLARALGLDPAAITRLLKGQRQIKAREIPKIEMYFDPGKYPLPEAADFPQARDAERAWTDVGTIPVFGAGEGEVGDAAEWCEKIVDHIAKPPFLSSAAGAYALFVADDSMWPRYTVGEVVYVHPGRPVTPDCFVVVQFSAFGPNKAQFAVRQFIRRSAMATVLRQLNPKKDISVPAIYLRKLHRVVGSGET